MRYARVYGTGNDFIVVPDIDDRLELGARSVYRATGTPESVPTAYFGVVGLTRRGQRRGSWITGT
jgi:diaminopimelate epimerase